MSSSNLWTIGTLDHINKGLGDLYAPNHFSGNQWHFKDQEGNWKIPSDPNDIQVMCIDQHFWRAVFHSQQNTIVLLKNIDEHSQLNRCLNGVEYDSTTICATKCSKSEVMLT